MDYYPGVGLDCCGLLLGEALWGATSATISGPWQSKSGRSACPGGPPDVVNHSLPPSLLWHGWRAVGCANRPGACLAGLSADDS